MSGKTMDKKLKTKWLRALRSGKYKQAIGGLTSVNTNTGKVIGHCCIGVLCKVADVFEQKLKYNNVDRCYDGNLMYGRGDTSDTAFLPQGAAYRLGLTSEMQDLLAKMNDGVVKHTVKGRRKSHTFKSIADFIETRIKAA